MLGFILLRYFLIFIVAPVFISFLAYLMFRKDPNDLHEKEVVMIPDGRHGRIVQKVVYEDMTVYGVLIADTVLHFERHQLIKVKSPSR